MVSVNPLGGVAVCVVPFRVASVMSATPLVVTVRLGRIDDPDATLVLTVLGVTSSGVVVSTLGKVRIWPANPPAVCVTVTLVPPSVPSVKVSLVSATSWPKDDVPASGEPVT
jgi:hypothetical protein